MKRFRLLVVSLTGLLVVLVGLLTFGNLNQNLVYYLTPAEALAQKADFADGKRFQIGGLVRDGSVVRTDRGIEFIVDSGAEPGPDAVRVSHRGSPAQLFRPGIGVVLEGRWQGEEFASDHMIVKHDENYAPPEDERSGAE
ncbi:cytochrome c maturation protein CcmE [Saccharopolyspora indica]|uniref:cytochrome c maturation protein CcmE n=1 Tax=Saccharopolyspora indica TaxID=1229659 RepID=UPI0022EA9ADC|nr:cytochrome c maturation protein CcmE [Saccharopolyspora indica]MDA3644080.1 cytochrome c maturation protein CcmE [Saccharopolyspora indica]